MTWRPFQDPPILVPTAALGADALTPEEAEPLISYLGELAAARDIPLHPAVALNALLFGFDVRSRRYLGGPLDLDSLPLVRSGMRCEPLPVGAMVRVPSGEDEVWGEVVYTEHAEPDVEAGDPPDWLSGAPVGAHAPAVEFAPATGNNGSTDAAEGSADLVLGLERVVVDFDVLGTERARVERCTGKQLDPLGHLLIEAAYPDGTADDADSIASARWLLTHQGEAVALAAPVIALTDESGAAQTWAALLGTLSTITTLLEQVPGLVRLPNGYFLSVPAFERRHAQRDDPLGGGDLNAIAAGLCRRERPRRGRSSGRSTRYAALGPRLREHDRTALRLRRTGYARAVGDATLAVIRYLADRSADGLVFGDVHVRLDDAGRSGGIWRTEQPGSIYADTDPLMPLSLGWLGALSNVVSSTATENLPDTTGTLVAPRHAEDDVPYQQPEIPPQEPAEPAGEPVASAAKRQAEPEAAPERRAAVPDERRDEEPVAPALPEAGPADPEAEPGADIDVTTLIRVGDSQLSWKVALRRSAIDNGWLPIDPAVADQMAAAGLDHDAFRLSLSHPGGEIDFSQQSQRVRTDLRRRILAGTGPSGPLDYPLGFFPGMILNCSWTKGTTVVRATSVLRPVPVTVNGIDIEHDFDRRILAAEFEPGDSDGSYNPIDELTTASLDQLVMLCVRRLGRLLPDGSVLMRRHRVAPILHRKRPTPGQIAAVEDVIDTLIVRGELRAGWLAGRQLQWVGTSSLGVLDADGHLTPVDTADAVDLAADSDAVAVISYTPVVTQSILPPRQTPHAAPLSPSHLKAVTVPPFLRQLPCGQHPGEDRNTLYRHLLAKAGMPVHDLPDGYTVVDEHVRRY